MQNLRSVSKESRDVLHGMIKKFSLELGGDHPPDLGKIVGFLRNVNLVNLAIGFRCASDAGDESMSGQRFLEDVCVP